MKCELEEVTSEHDEDDNENEEKSKENDSAAEQIANAVIRTGEPVLLHCSLSYIVASLSILPTELSKELATFALNAETSIHMLKYHTNPGRTQDH